MRLIDAESLLVNMDKGIQGTAREYLKFYQMAVNDEPTAYDVDKVIKKLEKGIEESALVTLKAAFKVAIDIVKSGGIE